MTSRALTLFRRADAADVALIAAFEIEVADGKLYGRPLERDAVLSEIAANQYHLLLLGDRLVATGALRLQDDGSAYLSNIAVLPSLRRQGLGRAMMNHLLGSCGGASSLTLAVHPDNEPAIALYRSLMFSPTIVRDNFFGDGEPRLMMTRTET